MEDKRMCQLCGMQLRRREDHTEIDCKNNQIVNLKASVHLYKSQITQEKTIFVKREEELSIKFLMAHQQRCSFEAKFREAEKQLAALVAENAGTRELLTILRRLLEGFNSYESEKRITEWNFRHLAAEYIEKIQALLTNPAPSKLVAVLREDLQWIIDMAEVSSDSIDRLESALKETP